MGLLGLSEHTPKGLWSRKSEYEYVNMTLTTLGCIILPDNVASVITQKYGDTLFYTNMEEYGQTWI